MINEGERRVLENLKREGDFSGGTAQELREWLRVVSQDAGPVWVENHEGVLITFTAKVVEDEGKKYVAIRPE